MNYFDLDNLFTNSGFFSNYHGVINNISANRYLGLVKANEYLGKYDGIETDEGKFFGMFAYFNNGFHSDEPEFTPQVSKKISMEEAIERARLEEESYNNNVAGARIHAMNHPYVIALVASVDTITNREYKKPVVPGYFARFNETTFNSDELKNERALMLGVGVGYKSSWLKFYSTRLQVV